MSFKTRKRRSASQGISVEQVLRVLGVAVIVFLFVVGGLGLSNNSTLGLTATPGLGATPLPGSPTPITFPQVPLGGTPLIAERTYFHPTGLFSIPRFRDFDLAADGEELADPAALGGTSKLSRVGATFINGAAYAVLHTFIENNPDNGVKELGDLEKLYDTVNLQAAWTNFTGGYEETGRKIVDGRYVLDFRLGLSGNTYLARQTTQVQEGWLKVTRLVVPDNNPGLLDNLEKAVWEKFAFYPKLLANPISWGAITDINAGYLIRFPAAWKRSSDFGGQYVVDGILGTTYTSLTTRNEPGRTVNSEDEARAWVKAFRPNATVYSAKTEQRDGLTLYTVSFNDPDPDGNSRSAIVTLVNGRGGLISAYYLHAARNVDLLTAPTAPAELATSRNTLQLLDTAILVPTLTPTVTPTPLPVTPTTAGATIPPAGTPTPAS
jgi:hypothetical protein